MKLFKVTLALALPMAMYSCQTAQVQSGKAIYCPGVQLEKVSSPNEVVSDMNWQPVDEDNAFVSITNLQNGKKAKTHILMKKVTATGSVIVSINKNTAEALGMTHTGMAPVEIRYARRTL